MNESQTKQKETRCVARLELLPAEFPLAFEHGEEIQERIKACGFRFVAVDLVGFRSGALNEGLIKAVNLA